MVQVLIRLSNGDVVEAGRAAGPPEAHAHAERLIELVRRGEWPFVDGRYVRPEAVVSIDLYEGRAADWSGSTTRARWAHADVSPSFGDGAASPVEGDAA